MSTIKPESPRKGAQRKKAHDDRKREHDKRQRDMGRKLARRQARRKVTTEMKLIWRVLYFGWACGWVFPWFPWAIGPHPLWANRVSEWLHYKWMQDSWDK